MLAAVLIAIAATATVCFAIAAIIMLEIGRHYRARLSDSRAELDRALLRINSLEQMLDESRANALNVTVPVKSDAKLTTRIQLPPEVVAELNEIEDDGDRAELESDIRVQLEADPTADPMTVARRVFGGQ